MKTKRAARAGRTAPPPCSAVDPRDPLTRIFDRLRAASRSKHAPRRMSAVDSHLLRMQVLNRPIGGVNCCCCRHIHGRPNNAVTGEETDR